MASVEAAASLFGAEDPASDPFASLGNDNAVPEQSAEDFFSSSNDTQGLDSSNAQTHSTAEDLFAPSNTTAEPQQAAVSSEASDNAWPYTASNDQTYTYGSNTHSSSYDQTQGWQDGQGQWKTYEAPSVDYNAAAQTPAPVTAQAAPAPAASHDYAPYSYNPAPTSYAPTSYAPTSYEPASHAPQPTTQSTTASYDPYAPPTQATQNYAPPVSVPTNTAQQSYGSYTPSSTYTTPTSPYGSVYSQPAPASYSTPPAVANSPPTIPAPPAPAAAPLNRPKVSNAYDPPFPTTSRARKGASRPAYSQHSGSAYQTSPPAQYSPVQYTSSPPLAGLPSSQHSGSPNAPYPPLVNPASWNQGQTGAPATDNHLVGSVYGLGGPTQAHAPLGAPATSSPYAPPAQGSYTHPPPPRAQPSAYEPYAAPSRDGLPDSYTPPQDYSSTVADSASAPRDSALSPSAEILSASIPEPPSTLAGSTDTQAESPTSYGLTPPHARVVSPSMLPLPDSPPIPQVQYGTSASRPTSPQTHAAPAAPDRDSGPPKRALTPSAPAPPPRSSSPLATNNHAPPNPYAPSSTTSTLARPTSPASSNQGGSRVSAYPEFNADPYAPRRASKHLNGIVRTSSPLSAPPLVSDFDPASAYAPPPSKHGGVPPPNDMHSRTVSNGSMYSTTSSATSDPYAPTSNNRQPGGADYGAYPSQTSYPATNEASPYGYVPTQTSQAVPAAQEISVKPTMGAYAPSPSLMGSNDPLGRTSARAPVICFGFGGKLVTCFHGAASMTSGFDVALSTRNSTNVDIRTMTNIIPKSALDTSSAVFPGPLFSDPGSATASSLVRTSATQTKNKKSQVIQYLDERIEEVSRSLGYVHQGSVDGRREEGKLVLVKLLKIMVENDGRISGTPEIDNAVRLVLVPRLENSPVESSTVITGLGFSAIPDFQGVGTDKETPIASSVLRPSALEKIQDLLVRGQRKEAYHYALDQKLWAHAMVIASGIDKEAWQEAVNEFLKADLGTKPAGTLDPQSAGPVTNGREGLRMVYSFLSGQGATAVQELKPPNSLSKPSNLLMVPTPQHTPKSPNFSSLPLSPLPEETCAQWTETLAMMLSSPMTKEASAAVTALGDQLAASHWIEAAHVCYLLSPQTSPLGGIGNPAARITLLGSRNPQLRPQSDTDPVVLTEVLEFALSLVTPAKGVEPFTGLPHLQAFRLLRATSLAEIGEIQLANRYCEAITASLGRPSPHFTPVFVEQLKGLVDRIHGTPNVDKSGSWIGSKLSKPSLDSIGGWLEGRFTKLVTGDSDSSTPPEAEQKSESQAFGPFSHYNSISSAMQSARSSPQPPNAPPPRSGSAMAYHPVSNGYPHIERAASAMDTLRRKPSPTSRTAPSTATTGSFNYTPAYGASHLDTSNSSPTASDALITPRASTSTDDDSSSQEVSWWGASSYGGGTSSTPTQFMHVDTPLSEAGGFVSLMDSTPFATPAQNGSVHKHPAAVQEEDDEEDLGFGNSSTKKRQTGDESEQGAKASERKPEAAKPAEPSRPDPKPTPAASSGSWLSRIWKRSETPTGPIKASLGEETSFYYDAELKRWVNKKAGSEPPKPAAPPPPPSRAQTTSPGKTTPSLPTGTSAGPPPPRAASAIDLSVSPPGNKPPMRMRSNLVPPPGIESAPSTPTGSRLVPNGAPPPGRPKSQAGKRNIRSRYVDVFSAEGGGAA
ncbi:hypothetical protein HGRIS_013040 [Hohenbuehelia grisea]|uniref:Protein transport protein sec16 n=1 Tax=Hohenbuehelia grisea TaxID=104357 RepID=A0ABR3IUE3_9AGAR